jgi:chromosome segregation ATPase
MIQQEPWQAIVAAIDKSMSEIECQIEISQTTAADLGRQLEAAKREVADAKAQVAQRQTEVQEMALQTEASKWTHLFRSCS